MYDICILSDEASFARMLELELADRGRRVAVAANEAALVPAALYLVDADRFPQAAPEGRTLFYAYSFEEDGDGRLRRPFSFATLLSAIDSGEKARGIVLLSGDAVSLDGVRIRLTRLEYALLARLVQEKGRPVSRETLYAEVFGGEGDLGVVNVYIHYLRKKLEKGGRRLICAMRGQGYMLRTEEDGL